jgi:hypothetical protein
LNLFIICCCGKCLGKCFHHEINVHRKDQPINQLSNLIRVKIKYHHMPFKSRVLPNVTIYYNLHKFSFFSAEQTRNKMRFFYCTNYFFCEISSNNFCCVAGFKGLAWFGFLKSQQQTWLTFIEIHACFFACNSKFFMWIFHLRFQISDE